MMRPLYLPLAGIMLALGAAGLVLPLLPTTPFLIVAFWLFSRSSKRAEAWMLNHQTIGPPLRSWQCERSITRLNKYRALLSMALSYAVLLLTTSPGIPVGTAVAGVLIGVGGYIATRPAPAILEIPFNQRM